MVHAAACGVVFVLLEMPEGERDAGLSEATREAIVGAITTGAPEPEQPDPDRAATTLWALLPDANGLPDGERQMLAEWLDRMVRSA